MSNVSHRPHFLHHVPDILFVFRLKTFDSGVMVLQLQSHDEDQVIHLTTQLVSQGSSKIVHLFTEVLFTSELI